jgi:hypothetical protein
MTYYSLATPQGTPWRAYPNAFDVWSVQLRGDRRKARRLVRRAQRLGFDVRIATVRQH